MNHRRQAALQGGAVAIARRLLLQIPGELRFALEDRIQPLDRSDHHDVRLVDLAAVSRCAVGLEFLQRLAAQVAPVQQKQRPERHHHTHPLAAQPVCCSNASIPGGPGLPVGEKGAAFLRAKRRCGQPHCLRHAGWARPDRRRATGRNRRAGREPWRSQRREQRSQGRGWDSAPEQQVLVDAAVVPVQQKRHDIGRCDWELRAVGVGPVRKSFHNRPEPIGIVVRLLHGTELQHRAGDPTPEISTDGCGNGHVMPLRIRLVIHRQIRLKPKVHLLLHRENRDIHDRDFGHRHHGRI